MMFPRAVDSALSEFRSNPRLRWGTWVLVAILWLYGNLLLRDLADARAHEYRALGARIARAQAAAKQAEWLTRVAPARSLQLSAEGRLWRATTAGLAQAALQDWLNQAAQQAGLNKAQIVVGTAEDVLVADKSAAAAAPHAAGSGLWKVSAKLAFDFHPKSLYALMQRVAEHDKQIVVEALNVRGAPAPKADAVLVAYFHKPAPPDR